MRTLVNLNPTAEFRSFEEAFDRLFGTPTRPSEPVASTLPIDITERENGLIIRASVAGIDPKDLEVQIEANVLTIRGETSFTSETKEEKVYRREIATGRFARSIRLPEGLNLENIDAEFRNGLVTITLPRQVEEKPKAVRINIRTSEPTNEAPTEQA